MPAKVYKPSKPMAKTPKAGASGKTPKTYTRFDQFQRIEHFVLILSFTLLAVTGIPQKYALNEISQFVINLFGGIESTRIIHRIAATVFLLQSVYHLIMAIYKVFVKKRPAAMVPSVKDGKDAFQWITFNLGLGKERPKMPRFNFMEKAEYWAMVWGLILMGLTGLMLWNPIATTNILPGEIIPAAKAAHGAEAVLAVLAIILWHFYHVHIKQFNKSMFTGQITRHEMIEEHGEELEAIESGRVAPLPPAATVRQRMAIFLPVAAVLTVVLVGLTIFFITFEDTAIATIPPISDVPVLVQATPSESQPTQAPVAEGTEAPSTAEPGAPAGDQLAWNGVIGTMMAENCAGCHGTMGGFSAETYDGMLQAITPGDPDASSAVQVQVAGGHPGQLDEASLATLIEWVEAGAPEGEAASAPAEEPASAYPVPTEAPADAGPAAELSWDGSIGPMFQENCARCHGNQGGFNAETLEGVYQALIPGDPENSQVIITQYNRHPEMFSQEDFETIYQWIAEGAPRH